MDLLIEGFESMLGQFLLLSFTLVALTFAAYTIYQIVIKGEESSKAIWILIVLLFPLVGSIIYWFNFKHKSRRRSFQPFKK